MFFLVTDIISILFILFLFYVLSMVWPPDSPWAPWWQMPEEVCRAIIRVAKISKKDKIYDLGCGSGKALIAAYTTTGATGVGIEIDPIRARWAKWNVWRAQAKGVTVIKNNFYNVSLTDATVLYIYLVPNALKRLVGKLTTELRPGTKIISYVYDLPQVYKGKVQLVTYDKKNKIFYYKFI